MDLQVRVLEQASIRADPYILPRMRHPADPAILTVLW